MERSSLLASRAAKPWQGRTLEGSGRSGARFWFCVEGSSLLVSRAAKPWHGRTLEGSGCETVAGAYSRGLWPKGALLDSRGFAWKGRHFWSRAAKPWQGRTLEDSGGSGARFWTPAVLRGKVVTFGFEGRETVAAPYLEGSGGSFWTPAVLRGRVVTFGLEGRETVAAPYSRGLWR